MSVNSGQSQGNPGLTVAPNSSSNLIVTQQPQQTIQNSNQIQTAPQQQNQVPGLLQQLDVGNVNNIAGADNNLSQTSGLMQSSQDQLLRMMQPPLNLQQMNQMVQNYNNIMAQNAGGNLNQQLMINTNLAAVGGPNGGPPAMIGLPTSNMNFIGDGQTSGSNFPQNPQQILAMNPGSFNANFPQQMGGIGQIGTQGVPTNSLAVGLGQSGVNFPPIGVSVPPNSNMPLQVGNLSYQQFSDAIYQSMMANRGYQHPGAGIGMGLMAGANFQFAQPQQQDALNNNQDPGRYSQPSNQASGNNNVQQGLDSGYTRRRRDRREALGSGGGLDENGR